MPGTPVPADILLATRPIARETAHMTSTHIVILLISILMWVGAAAVVLYAVGRMNLFGRKPK